MLSGSVIFSCDELLARDIVTVRYSKVTPTHPHTHTAAAAGCILSGNQTKHKIPPMKIR